MNFFSRRAKAYLIDLLLLWVVVVAVVSAFVITKALLFHLTPTQWRALAASDQTRLIGRGLHLFLYLSYFTICHWYSGQTIGKWLLKLKVIDSRTKSDLSFGQAFLRSLGYVLNTSLTLGFGFLMAYFRKDHSGLHDLMAHTTVAEARETMAANGSANLAA